MKRSIKRFFAIMVTMMICSSFAFTVVHADAYDHISFETMAATSYAKGATQQLTITAYDGSGNIVAFSGDVTYSSSNERVVTVSSTGLMTMVNYGVATVTATSGGKTASMLVTVRSKLYTGNAMSGNGSDFTRTGGSVTRKNVGATYAAGATNYDYSLSYAYYGWILSLYDSTQENTNGTANAVMSVWFYDNGATTDSVAAVYMSAYKCDVSGTRAVGILNSSDNTYKVTGKGARRARTGEQSWRDGDRVGICDEVLNAAQIDTGIERTKGWHQVSFIKKNSSNAATISDNGTRYCSNYYAIYLDGQFVYEEDGTNRSFLYMYGYAGWNGSNVAYFADAEVSQYIYVEDLGVTESSGTYTINGTYYGTTGTQTKTYKWQVSNDGAAGWSDFTTGQSTTPDLERYGNKFIRGAVKVATSGGAGATTDYYYTDPVFLYDGRYQHISLGKNPGSYTKGASNQQLSLIGYAKDMEERTIADLTGATFSSSNENVVTVTNAGVLTAVNYGVATVTAKYQGLTATMLVTVTNTDYESMADDGSTFKRTQSSTTKAKTGGTLALGTADAYYALANYNWLMSMWDSSGISTGSANTVTNIWFYDNGTDDDAIAAVYLSSYEKDQYGTRAVGIINSSDTTYKVTGKGARRARTGGSTWRGGDCVGISSEQTDSLVDTEIARTKGWHQVSFLKKSVNNVTVALNNKDIIRGSDHYDIYLDGQLVYGEDVNTGFVYMYGYAGFDGSHTAYFADAKVVQYVGVEAETLSESSGTYTVNHTSYVTKGSKTNAYKWQVSNDGVTGWTDIAGATSQSFTPSVATYGDKFIRGGVMVTTASDETGYYYKPVLIFNGTYQHISLGKNTSYYTKGATNQQLSLVGYAKDMEERTISDLTGATFSSSNENVVTVTNAGVLTAVDYGIATVTATYQGFTATMLVTVTNSTVQIVESGYAEGIHSNDIVRTGSYSYKITGGTLESGTEDYYYDYAKMNALLSEWNRVPANASINVWFYDNGSNDDAVAGVYWSAYSIDQRGTKVAGILDSSDTTYKLTGVNTRRARTGGSTWREGAHVNVCKEPQTPIDTEIARTKGWHQVTFLRKNTNASAIVSEKGADFPKSTMYAIYIDGQFVHSETITNDKDFNLFVTLYGYAGYHANHSAYIANPQIVQYIGVEDVALTETNSTFTVGHTYYGTTGAQTNTYKWQTSDDGLTGWTDIVGATGSTYTPVFNDRNKYIRGLVSVATGVTTGYVGSAVETPNFSLMGAEVDPTQINVNLKILNDTEVSIPYALMIGYYNAAETEVVAFDSQVSNVASGSSKTTHTFTIPEAIRGNFSKARIFLWENLNQITPYTHDILAE